MCQVQRVVNSCGHKNDHVLLVCHVAKMQTLSLSSYSGNGNCNRNCTNPMVIPSFCSQLAVPIPITDSPDLKSAHHHHRPHHNDNNNNLKCSSVAGNTITTGGFHAYTEPYCIYATIRTLDSPKGFKCMVNGCETAD